jgi:hypothetical protein
MQNAWSHRASYASPRRWLAHAVNFAIAFAGYVRWSCGCLLLRLLIRLTRRQSPQDSFSSAWRLIEGVPWLFAGHWYFSNRHRVPWRTFALLELLRLLRKARKPVSVKTRIVGSNAVSEVPLQTPIAVVMAHAASVHLLPLLSQALADLGRASEFVAVSAAAVERDRLRLGMRMCLNIITRNNMTMLAIRKKWRAQLAVGCCIDFSLRRPGTVYHDTFVSDAFLRLADAARVPTIFATPRVDEKGDVELHFFPLPADESLDPVAEVERIQNLMEAMSGERPRWTLTKWNPDLRQERMLLKRVCITETVRS